MANLRKFGKKGEWFVIFMFHSTALVRPSQHILFRIGARKGRESAFIRTKQNSFGF
jgi:hypothetical protein